MIGLKSARVAVLGTLAIGLSACGTGFRSLTLSTQRSAGGGGSGVVGPPPVMPAGEPVLNEFPGTANTGVPSGFSLRASGALTITTPGTVIDSYNISGVVRIKANNVTLRRSRVTVANYVQVSIDADLTGVVVEDCEINGVGTGNEGAMGIQGPGKFLRNNIHHVQTGIVPNSGALIQDNYIHDLQASGLTSYNGIKIEGGVDNVLIYHNSIVNQAAQQSAVSITNFYGHVSAVTVKENLLSGGQYAVICDAQYSPSALSSISFTGNSMSTGAIGYRHFNLCSPVFSGNFDSSTGTTIP